MRPEISLLRDLVGIPSVSGTEGRLAEWVEQWARAAGLDVLRDDASVSIRVRGRAAGPTLAFVSHLDTVPAGEGWTRSPFEPVIEGDRLYGRGSGDAKASVATMLLAASDLAAGGGAARGDLLVILGYGEETRHTTMGTAVERLGRIDAAVVGEPTNLDFAVAQRGLMMVDLVARGTQRHAGYAADTPDFTNAIVELGRNLAVLPGLFTDRVHPILGVATATPTMVEGGVSRNVTPPSARAVLDVRSTPGWTHAELAAAMRQALDVEVVVTSDRLVPCETPPDSALLRAAGRVRPAGRQFGSPTCSDWVFLRDRDALKCGPGTSRRSHTADEHVDLAEVTEARAFYHQLAQTYLA
ncbi:MAG: M20/M25/M40 family metallo-hydrolase [Gemmatimonadota bacterium]|nr:M20/M25/M40 family metallo-hydrolase [Gemmatimonadota bacterium]MDH4348425.1 M20/M25/M40 family metallo-hydrolase [Gemmatimonadota bacterium]MDH5282877.1 M20/M25/M40 family metallo-hydrolase [Gemmatimonadota bacterium]